MHQQSKIGIFLLAVAALVGVYAARYGSFTQPAPGFSLPELYGGRVDLDSYRGRPVLLVFWTTSCSICQRELPLLSQLEPEFRGKGIDIVAIHLGGEAEARNYMSSNRIDLTAVADSEGTVANAYRVIGVPKLVLVGKDGRVKRSRSGWTSESVLRDWVDTYSGS